MEGVDPIVDIFNYANILGHHFGLSDRLSICFIHLAIHISSFTMGVKM